MWGGGKNSKPDIPEDPTGENQEVHVETPTDLTGTLYNSAYNVSEDINKIPSKNDFAIKTNGILLSPEYSNVSDLDGYQFETPNEIGKLETLDTVEVVKYLDLIAQCKQTRDVAFSLCDRLNVWSNKYRIQFNNITNELKIETVDAYEYRSINFNYDENKKSIITIAIVRQYQQDVIEFVENDYIKYIRTSSGYKEINIINLKKDYEVSQFYISNNNGESSLNTITSKIGDYYYSYIYKDKPLIRVYDSNGRLLYIYSKSIANYDTYEFNLSMLTGWDKVYYKDNKACIAKGDNIIDNVSKADGGYYLNMIENVDLSELGLSFKNGVDYVKLTSDIIEQLPAKNCIGIDNDKLIGVSFDIFEDVFDVTHYDLSEKRNEAGRKDESNAIWIYAKDVNNNTITASGTASIDTKFNFNIDVATTGETPQIVGVDSEGFMHLIEPKSYQYTLSLFSSNGIKELATKSFDTFGEEAKLDGNVELEEAIVGNDCYLILSLYGLDENGKKTLITSTVEFENVAMEDKSININKDVTYSNGRLYNFDYDYKLSKVSKYIKLSRTYNIKKENFLISILGFDNRVISSTLVKSTDAEFTLEKPNDIPDGYYFEKYYNYNDSSSAAFTKINPSELKTDLTLYGSYLQKVSESTNEGITTTYTRDDNGNMISSISKDILGNIISKTLYENIILGEISGVKSSIYNSSNELVGQYFEYFDGNESIFLPLLTIAEAVDPDIGQCQIENKYNYNDELELIKQTNTTKDIFGNVISITIIEDSTFKNVAGKLASKYDNNEVLLEQSFEYDVHGSNERISLFKHYQFETENSDVVYEYDDDLKLIKQTDTTKDNLGNIISIRITENSTFKNVAGMLSSEYDSNDKLQHKAFMYVVDGNSEIIILYHDMFGQTSEYEYNDDLKEIKQTITEKNASGDVISIRIIEDSIFKNVAGKLSSKYDVNNKLVSQSFAYTVDGIDKHITLLDSYSDNTYSYETNYEYDDNLEPIKRTTTKTDNLDNVVSIKVVVDSTFKNVAGKLTSEYDSNDKLQHKAFMYVVDGNSEIIILYHDMFGQTSEYEYNDDLKEIKQTITEKNASGDVISIRIIEDSIFKNVAGKLDTKYDGNNKLVYQDFIYVVDGENNRISLFDSYYSDSYNYEKKCEYNDDLKIVKETYTSTSSSSYVKTFEYTNGLLVKTVSTTSNDIRTKIYEYESGELLQTTELATNLDGGFIFKWITKPEVYDSHIGEMKYYYNSKDELLAKEFSYYDENHILVRIEL